MLSRYTGTLLLYVFILAALLIAAYLIIDVGLLNWIAGKDLQAFLWRQRDEIANYVSRDDVDKALKALGLLTTTILGVLTAQRLWQFAEDNLPARMQEFVDRLAKVDIEDRAWALAPYATRNLQGDRVLRERRSFFEQLTEWAGYDKCTRAGVRVVAAVAEHDDYIPSLESQVKRFKAMQVSALLLEGSREVADRSAGSDIRIAALQNAFAKAEKAVSIVPSDVDALESAAKYAAMLNRDDKLEHYLNQLEVAAAAAGRHVRRARALRLQAERLGQRTAAAARRQARAQLDLAIETLRHPDHLAEVAERQLELGLANEQLASLHILRGAPTLVGPAIAAARTAYALVGGEEENAGLGRLKQLEDSWAVAAAAGDDPEDADPASPTHVTLKQCGFHLTANGQLVYTLQAFTGVRLVSSDGSWSKVRLVGGEEGFVHSPALQRLN